MSNADSWTVCTAPRIAWSAARVRPSSTARARSANAAAPTAAVLAARRLGFVDEHHRYPVAHWVAAAAAAAHQVRRLVADRRVIDRAGEDRQELGIDRHPRTLAATAS